MPVKRSSVQRTIVYYIDGTRLVRDVWLEQVPTQQDQEDDGARDFLKWLSNVQSTPTHTSKSFRVIFNGQPREIRNKLKVKGLDVFFSGKSNVDNYMMDMVRSPRQRQNQVVLVTPESMLFREAKVQGMRCITPQDFLMIFQAIV